MAINIEIVSDVSAVVKDTKLVADRYDAVSDTLKDVATAGESAGRDLERAFQDGIRAAEDLESEGRKVESAAGLIGKAGKDAGRDLEKGLKDGEDAAEDLKRKADDAFDKISADARASGKKVGDSQKDGFKEAESGVKEFGDEANSTAKESAASFDGSAESIIDSFQEVAANAFAGFGPAGALAGLAAAAGIGMAVTKMQEGAEAADEMKGKAIDLASKIQEAGGKIEDLDLGGIISDWGRETLEDNWITFWTNEASTNFQEAAKDAKAAGVDIQDAMKAAGGSAEDSQRFLEGTGQAWQDLSKAIDEGTTYTADGIPVMDESATAAKKQRDALSDLRGQAEDNITTTGDAIEIAELEQDAIKGTVEWYQKKADAMDEAAGVVKDADEAEVDYFNTLRESKEAIEENGKATKLSTKAGGANREALIAQADAATAYTDSLIAQGAEAGTVAGKMKTLRADFIKAATASGMGEEAAKKLADSYGLIPANVKTKVKAEGTKETKAEVDEAAKDQDAKVTTKAEGTKETKDEVTEAAKDQDTKVKTKAENTRPTKKEIDDVAKDRDTAITLRIANAADIRAQIDELTKPRDLFVNVKKSPNSRPIVP